VIGKIFLSGRAFVPLGESTIEHDIEFTRLLSKAGLDAASLREGETPDTHGWRVLKALVEARALLSLIACLVIPAEAAPHPTPGGFAGWLVRVLVRAGIMQAPEKRGWTPALAKETEEFLGQLDDPADKEKVYQLAAELLLPFLRVGVVSWASFLRSLLVTTTATQNPVTSEPPGATSVPGGV
jgi:hypothetical protein